MIGPFPRQAQERVRQLNWDRSDAERREPRPAMQSPIGVLIRVIVMMGCLVAVPLTAMFGTSTLSQVGNLVFDGPWSAKPASARESQPEGSREEKAARRTPVAQSPSRVFAKVDILSGPQTPDAAPTHPVTPPDPPGSRLTSGPRAERRLSDAELIRSVLSRTGGNSAVSAASGDARFEFRP